MVLQADPDTRTLRFKPEYTVIEPLPETQKAALRVTNSAPTLLATLPKKALEDLVSLEVYNYRNITTEFTQEADRHKVASAIGLRASRCPVLVWRMALPRRPSMVLMLLQAMYGANVVQDTTTTAVPAKRMATTGDLRY
eukprot:1333770-Rhodomonas_salina.4